MMDLQKSMMYLQWCFCKRHDVFPITRVVFPEKHDGLLNDVLSQIDDVSTKTRGPKSLPLPICSGAEQWTQLWSQEGPRQVPHPLPAPAMNPYGRLVKKDFYGMDLHAVYIDFYNLSDTRRGAFLGVWCRGRVCLSARDGRIHRSARACILHTLWWNIEGFTPDCRAG